MYVRSEEGYDTDFAGGGEREVVGQVDFGGGGDGREPQQPRTTVESGDGGIGCGVGVGVGGPVVEGSRRRRPEHSDGHVGCAPEPAAAAAARPAGRCQRCRLARNVRQLGDEIRFDRGKGVESGEQFAVQRVRRAAADAHKMAARGVVQPPAPVQLRHPSQQPPGRRHGLGGQRLPATTAVGDEVGT
jgi:hypothetical protein